MNNTIVMMIRAYGTKTLGFLLVLTVLLLASMPTLAHQVLNSQPDNPDALGSISGRVTNIENVPLEGIEVWLNYRNSNAGGSNGVGPILTDSQGNYRIDKLKTELYVLVFYDPTGQYGETFTGDTLSWSDAEKIPVVGNDVTGVDVTMQPTTGIAGTVTVVNADEFRGGSFDITVYSKTTDEYSGNIYWRHEASDYASLDNDSSYNFSSLAAGTYRVCANFYGDVETTDGTYDYRNYSECYNDIVSGIDFADDIVVQDDQVASGIDFALGESSEYGSISGNVTDTNGDPVAGLTVAAYPAPGPYYSFRPRTDTTTDENGDYTLDIVLPVTTTVLFDAQGTRYASEYYDNVRNSQDAQSFIVESGGLIENVDAQLELGGSVSGKLTFQGAEVNESARITLYREESALYDFDTEPYYYYYQSFDDAYDSETGLYLVEGLPNGSYLVKATLDYYLGGYNYFEQYYGGLGHENATPISVTLGMTTTDIDISIAEGQFEGAIEGTVTSDGEPLAGIQVQLYPGYYYNCSPEYDPYCNTHFYDYNEYGLISYAVTDESGNYQIGGLTTSDYSIRFVSPDGSYAPDAYYNAEGNPLVNIEDGQTVSGIDGDLEIGARVSGLIQRSNGEPASNYEIVVEQDTELGTRVVFLGITTDSDGYYKVQGLPSGEYTLRFLPAYSYTTHLRLNVTVEGGEDVDGFGGVAGPGVPTSLPLAYEPSDDGASDDEPTDGAPQMTDFLFVPLTVQ